MSTALATVSNRPPSLVEKFASRYTIDAEKLLPILKATAFKVKDGEVTNEQMAALLVVADQYGLNPFTKEIFAFPDKGGIVPVVGVDGWARIINSHEAFDGMDFEQDAESCTCIIYRKDRTHPIKITEYLVECKRGTQPWTSHPRRMLRHKAMIQCARVAFSYSGIYDEDEAERIIERDMGQAVQVAMPQSKTEKRASGGSQPVDASIDTGSSRSESEVKTSQIPAEPRASQPSSATPPAAKDPAPPSGESAPAGGADSGEHLSEGERNHIKQRLEKAALTEIDLKAKFGKGLAELTKDDFGSVVTWMKNPAA